MQDLESDYAPTTPAEPGDLEVRAPSAETATGEVPIPDTANSEQRRREAAAVADADPGEGYGPWRPTGLTRALRNNLEFLDSVRPARAPDSSEILKTELANGKWLGKSKRWKIDWNSSALTRRHDWRKVKYIPQQDECPLPLD